MSNDAAETEKYDRGRSLNTADVDGLQKEMGDGEPSSTPFSELQRLTTAVPSTPETDAKAREQFRALRDMGTVQKEEKQHVIMDILWVASGWGQWDQALGKEVGLKMFGNFNAVLAEAGGFEFLTTRIETADTSNPETPFTYAAANNGMWEVDQERFLMMLLMAHDQDKRSQLIAPFGSRQSHKTALYLAARSGRANVLKSMLSCLKDSVCFELLMLKDWRSWNALLAAVAMENFHATKTILETIPKFDSKDQRAKLLFSADRVGHTALHLAISANNSAMAILLLKAMEKHIPPEHGKANATEELDAMLTNVITYAIQLNRTEIIKEALKEAPEVVSRGLVTKAFHFSNTIGEIISDVLAPKFQTNTETGTLWSPCVALGGDPWVKEITSRLPKKDQKFVMRKSEDEGVRTDKRVMTWAEQEEVEKGPDPCPVLKILVGPLTRRCSRLSEVAKSWRLLLLDEPRVPCQAHLLPQRLLTSTDVLQGLTSVNSGALGTPLAQGILAKWWIEFELYYHLDIFLNVVHVGLACFLTFASRSRRTWDATFMVCFSFTASLILKDLLDKLFQILPTAWYLLHKFLQALCKSPGKDRPNQPVRQLADYFRELLDIGRLVVQIFALYFLCCQKAGQDADNTTKTVTAIWVFFWWCHCLYDLRGLRCVGPRLLPIFWAISDIAVRSFGAVVLCLIAASTHAFYVLAVRDGVSPIYAAVLHMYRLGVLGDFDMFELEGEDPTLVAAGEGVWEPKDPEASSLYWHVHGLFFLVTTLILLLLMNLFINILGSSSDRSLDIAEELFTSTRAKLVLEYEAAFIPCFRLLCRKCQAKSGIPTADVACEPTESCSSSSEGKELMTMHIVLRTEVGSPDQSMRNFVRQQLEGVEKKLNMFQNWMGGDNVQGKDAFKEIFKSPYISKQGNRHPMSQGYDGTGSFAHQASASQPRADVQQPPSQQEQSATGQSMAYGGPSPPPRTWNTPLGNTPMGNRQYPPMSMQYPSMIIQPGTVGKVEQVERLSPPGDIAFIHLRVKRCYNLISRGTDFDGDVSSPFVIVRVGKQTERTPTIDRNLNPVWDRNNVFKFEVQASDTMLELEVWSSHVLSTSPPHAFDLCLGRHTMDLRLMPTSSWVSKRANLAEGEQSEIEFDVLYAPPLGPKGTQSS